MSSTAQVIDARVTAQAASAGDSVIDLEFVPVSKFDSDLRRLSYSFLESQRSCHPFQFPDWSTEESSLYLLARRQNKIQAFARCDVIWPLGKRFHRVRALTLTRGPVCDDPVLMLAALQQLVDLSRSRGFLYLDVNPDWIDPDARSLVNWLHAQGWFTAGPARASLRLDLRLELETIFASFRKTTRLEVQKAEGAGVKVVADDAASIDHFVRLYLDMAKAKDFAPEPEHHLRHVLAWLLQNRTRGVLLTAMWRGDILGGVVAVRAASRCWYVWGATSKNCAVNVGHLLQWQAIKWARSQGCTEYDLGGFRVGATDGPALFKRGFSQNVVSFLPTYRHPLNSARYSIYKVLTPGLYKAKALLEAINPLRQRLPESR